MVGAAAVGTAHGWVRACDVCCTYFPVVPVGKFWGQAVPVWQALRGMDQIMGKGLDVTPEEVRIQPQPWPTTVLMHYSMGAGHMQAAEGRLAPP